MAGPITGDAIFSTHLGRFAPREAALMPPRIILRSVPEDDMEAMIEELQTKYPAQCKAMQAPITNIHEYFDNYDQHLHGQMFLHTVLMEIYFRNVIRRRAILDYTEAWSRLNPAAFECIYEYELNAFTEDDVEEYGEDFLQEVLQELQLRKSKREEAVALANEKAYVQNQERIQQANARPFAICPPQEQECITYAQRNSSAPPSSHIAFAQPRLTPSIPSSTPGLGQFVLPHPLIPSPLQRFDNANSRSAEAPPQSAPLLPSRRTEHSSDPTDSGIDFSRAGFPDTIGAMPPPGPMPGPFSFHRVPAGPRSFHHPVNKSRTLPRTRGPVYIGPPNDARVLEKQGVLRHHSSFGEGRMSRGFQHPYSHQIPYPKSYPPFQHSQHNQPNGGPINLPPQDYGHPASGPNTFAGRVMSRDANRASTKSDRVSFRTDQYPTERPQIDRLNGPYEQDRTIPPQQFATPSRQCQHIFHEPDTAKRHGFPDITPPNHVQRKFEAVPITSPTRHRFLNTSPPESIPKTHDTGEYQYTPDSHTHRSDRNYSVSDRKVWIGGLMPEANNEIITRLLEPWGPVNVSKILVSKTMKPQQGPHHAFAFAEFDMPQKAASAIEALNEQYVDVLQYKIFLKPAYIRPISDWYSGSPKKTDSRTNRHSDRHTTRDNEGRKRAWSMNPQVNIQGPDSFILKQPDQASHSRDQLSAEWPALGTNTVHSSPVSQFTSDLQSHTSQDAPKQRASPQISTSKEFQMANDHELTDPQGSAAPHVTSSTAEAAEHNILPPASKTHSPLKKKNRSATMGELMTGKAAQAKQRKEMLSGLRTEKSSAAASNSVPCTPVLENDQQTHSFSGIDLVSDEKGSSAHQGIIAEDDSTPPLGLKDDAEIAATTQSTQSKGQVSPVQSASTDERSLNSASMIISTYPTSDAQFKHSESGTIDFQTSFNHDKSGLPMPVSQSAQETSNNPVDVSKFNHTLAEAGNPKLARKDQTSVSSGQVADQASNSGSPSVITIHTPNTAAVQTPQALLETAVKGGEDIAPSTNDTDSFSSCKPKGNAATQEEVNEKPHRREAESQRVSSAMQPDRSAGTLNKESVQPRMLDDHAASSRLAPLEVSTRPSQDKQFSVEPQPASPPVLKRGSLKNPKVLIATPKSLPSARSKPKPQGTCIQEVNQSNKSSVSIELLNAPRDANINTTRSPDTPQNNSSGPSTSFAKAEKRLGQTPGAPVTQKIKVHPGVFVNTDRSLDIVKGTQTDSEGNTVTNELISVSDSVVTMEDDRLDPDTSTPQSFAAAMIDLANNASKIQPSPEQSAMQQKKKKLKKGKKKPKKSKCSQAEPAENDIKTPAQSSATKRREQTAKVVQVETPFLSDDKQPLPRPFFALQNHSSMRSRTGPWLRTQQLNSTTSSTVRKGNERQYPIVFETPTKDTGGQDSTVSQAELLAEPRVSENVEVQNTSTETREIDVPSKSLEQPHMVDEAERQARIKQLDVYLEENDMVSRRELLNILNMIAPERPTDGVNGPSSPPGSRGFNGPEVLNGPRVEEISSDDDPQTFHPPTAPLKQRERRMLPSRDASPAPLPTRDSSKGRVEPGEIDVVDGEDGTSNSNEGVIASFPCTRRTSPERGRFRSVSPRKGLGLSVDGRPSTKLENISPSRPESRKALSYKQVASTPPIQPGEIFEIVLKEPGLEGKDGQGITVVRKAGGKDPWRVPSSEQPWGGINKAKGGNSAEASETSK